MITGLHRAVRPTALLAINALFLTVWGFAGFSKVSSGVPAYFPDKFGGTLLASFPGLSPTFWILTASELVAFGLGAVALVRREFLERRSPMFLPACLAWSLMVFVQLSFGQWLTNEFVGAAQQFSYFAGTLMALHYLTVGAGRPS